MASALEPIYQKLKSLEELGAQTPKLLMDRLSEMPAVPQMLGKIIGSKSVMEEVVNLLQSWEEPLGKLSDLEKSQESQEQELKEIKQKLEHLARSLETIKLRPQKEEMRASKKLLEDVTRKQAEMEKQTLEFRKEIQDWAENLKTWQTNSPSKNQIERLQNQVELLQDDLQRKSLNSIAGRSNVLNPWVVGLLVANLLLTVGVGWMVFKTMQVPKTFLVPKTSVRK
jgi:chromosome segregation ATPase